MRLINFFISMIRVMLVGMSCTVYPNYVPWPFYWCICLIITLLLLMTNIFVMVDVLYITGSHIPFSLPCCTKTIDDIPWFTEREVEMS